MELLMDEAKTPIGTVVLVTDGRSLCALDFDDCRNRMMDLLRARYGRSTLQPAHDPLGVSSAVRAYMEGDLHALDDVPVDAGGTPFQRAVWRELRNIPLGTTMSYADLARAVGRPKAARAVGATNGRNPVALVIPCHRVVGADGSLSGYAGGVERKRWLLDHEGADLGRHQYTVVPFHGRLTPWEGGPTGAARKKAATLSLCSLGHLEPPRHLCIHTARDFGPTNADKCWLEFGTVAVEQVLTYD